jgi:peptide-methionine (S)-S-oxide reductase
MLERMLRLLLLLFAGLLTMQAAEQQTKESGAKSATNSTQLATFGGGCFWCTEALFDRVKGVKKTISGYAGGAKENPSYKEVCNGTTGHAEVLQVEFDPKEVSYETLLEIFFDTHDPTTLNQQGADVGTQYRSIILYHDDAQKQAAEKMKNAAGSKYGDPITTEIVPLKKFYPAEDYHQDYFAKNPNAPYCAFVIRPKLQKFLKKQGKS